MSERRIFEDPEEQAVYEDGLGDAQLGREMCRLDEEPRKSYPLAYAAGYWTAYEEFLDDRDAKTDTV